MHCANPISFVFIIFSYEHEVLMPIAKKLCGNPTQKMFQIYNTYIILNPSELELKTAINDIRELLDTARFLTIIVFSKKMNIVDAMEYFLSSMKFVINYISITPILILSVDKSMKIVYNYVNTFYASKGLCGIVYFKYVKNVENLIRFLENGILINCSLYKYATRRVQNNAVLGRKILIRSNEFLKKLEDYLEKIFLEKRIHKRNYLYKLYFNWCENDILLGKSTFWKWFLLRASGIATGFGLGYILPVEKITSSIPILNSSWHSLIIMIIKYSPVIFVILIFIVSRIISNYKCRRMLRKYLEEKI